MRIITPLFFLNALPAVRAGNSALLTLRNTNLQRVAALHILLLAIEDINPVVTATNLQHFAITAQFIQRTQLAPAIRSVTHFTALGAVNHGIPVVFVICAVALAQGFLLLIP